MDVVAYFYDYFVKDYQKKHEERQFNDPAAIFRNIERERVRICRKVLRNAFSGYRDGQKMETLKKLIGEYRNYISEHPDERAKDRYNAFVYRYMVSSHVGMKAIAVKLGVTKDSVRVYIDRALDELLMFCMGIPAMTKYPEEKEKVVQMLIDGSRIFDNLAGDYVIDLFPGRTERDAVEHGRQLTDTVMEIFAEAAVAYSNYCKDSNTSIDTDIRKAEILGKCLAGVPCCQIAEEYGCCEGTIYSDMRDNEKRLAAMIFRTDGGESYGNRT